ncbi:10060_t:CDS:2 [Cetraspora pellucida]|uniref:10060_t:CDS:1 n=1 Tax=Cetraspora pellucida TaxID=1433469 RepID=A0ACA9MRJ1_9GLOM|nr:10060_t:CDS:2 [Cetraspora pellucida]
MSNAYPEHIEEFSIKIADYIPIGSTGHMPLPETIPKCNNVHPERNLHRIYAKYINELNMEDIPISVLVSTPVYQKFEKNNLEISLCQINLLVISEADDLENTQTHYCIIKDLHRLVYNHSKHKKRKYLYHFYLCVYSTEKGFNEHRANPKKCLGVNNTPQIPKVPTLEKSIKAFNNYKCMQPNQYRII